MAVFALAGVALAGVASAGVAFADPAFVRGAFADFARADPTLAERAAALDGGGVTAFALAPRTAGVGVAGVVTAPAARVGRFGLALRMS